MPMPRSRGGRAVTSRPSTRMRPPLGCSRPASRRQAVVLPEPDGPSSTRNSPASKARSSARSATVPPAKVLVTRSNRMVMRTLSAFDRAEGQATHELPLDDEGEEDDRQRGHDGNGFHLAPQRAVRRHQARYADGERPALEGNQDEGIEELVPGQDEAQDRRC